MKYFAYGSNMSLKRLLARKVGAALIGVARLTDYDLRFHKISKKDGSGKCDVFYTGDTQDEVIGVLFDIHAGDMPRLDSIEGVGGGYERIKVKVLMNGELMKAATYTATNIDASLKPYDWYLYHVVFGAKSNSLPAEYIQRLENTNLFPDPDRDRYDCEMSIYN